MELPDDWVRVAKAIAEATNGSEVGWLDWVGEARAAIEAMNLPALLEAERLSATERAAKIADPIDINNTGVTAYEKQAYDLRVIISRAIRSQP